MVETASPAIFFSSCFISFAVCNSEWEEHDYLNMYMCIPSLHMDGIFGLQGCLNTVKCRKLSKYLNDILITYTCALSFFNPVYRLVHI